MPQALNASQPDLYSDAPPDTSAPPAEDVEETATPEESEDKSGNTAVLPTGFFEGDVKPGDTCTVTVVRVHDNQVEVKYDKAAEAEEYGEDVGSEAPPPQGEMASMME